MDIGLLNRYIAPGQKVFLVGIGGVSMCALAEVLYGKGVSVSGSDMMQSNATKHLSEVGIPVFIGHDAANIQGTACLIRTAAVHEDNPEIMQARKLGLPVFERAQAWGAIMRNYRNAACVSGTHGKTTTTSMITHIALSAGIDPTVMIGGTLPVIGAGHRVGRGDTIVLEACEYCDSFLSFFPTLAVILNVEEDHLDYFSGIDHIVDSFRRFARLVPEDGTVVYNLDNENTVKAVSDVACRKINFGLDKNAQVRADNITFSAGLASFDLIRDGESLCYINLNVPGRHNVSNALAAAAAALSLGIEARYIKAGLEAFSGTGRRFEYKGEYGGAVIYDDYAHHPSEIAATLGAAQNMGYERVVLVFQPHTYTRTKALLDDFAVELGKADVLILSEIYAAREKNTIGISSGDLAEKIEGAQYIRDFTRIADYLKSQLRPGDLLLTMGAGDIYKVGDLLLEQE